jgi:hypothetical protein
MRSVPLTRGSTPKLGSLKSAVHLVPVRKSQRDTSTKNSTACSISTSTMPTVVRTDSAPQAKRTAPITRSEPRRLLRPVRSSVGGRIPVTSGDAAGPTPCPIRLSLTAVLPG